MPEIDSIYVDYNKSTYTLADLTARQKINSIIITPMQEAELPETGDSVNEGFSKVNKYIQSMEENFQDGVDKLANACIGKGSAPAEPYTPDTVADAIDAIQTGGNYGTLEVREDGTYRASDDPDYDAYDVVVVSKDVGQPHTVVFYGPDGSIIKTQANVPYHGYASCTVLDGTQIEGLYFKGQNPVPTNIIRDTFCYPQYGEYSISSGEIEDDQETICSNKGAFYPIGSYKPLVFTASTSPVHRFYDDTDNTRYVDVNLGASGNIVVHMVKVAEGEDGSTSTWLSNSKISLPFFNSYTFQTVKSEQDQENSGTRAYLQEGLFQDLPIYLKDTIKTVTKQTKSSYPRQRGGGKSSVLRETLDKVQIPSIKELSGLLRRQPTEHLNGVTDIRTSGDGSRPSTDPDYIQSLINDEYETKGIDYCANQYPTGQFNSNPVYLRVRSMAYPTSYNMINDTIQLDNDYLNVRHLFDQNYQAYSPIGFCL